KGQDVQAYIIARVIAVIPTLLLLLLAVVAMVRLLPGSAVDALEAQAAAQGATVDLSEADRTEIERRLGLDGSFLTQYIDYTVGAVQGDLGESVWSRESVTAIIGRALPVTLVLTGLALIWATIIGIGVGLVSAARQ